MDIIDRIKIIITDCKMSELGLSSKIGISQRSINYYLSRKQKPSLEFISKIIEIFNIDANWLLTGDGNMENINTLVSSTDGNNDPLVTYLKEEIKELKNEKDSLILENKRLTGENQYYRGLLDSNGINYKQTAS